MNKLIGRAVLPLLGLALLAGCSPTGGTAAFVNDVAVPDSRVSEFAEGCSAVLMDDESQLARTPNQLRSAMVQWAVLGEMSRQQLASMGIEPTDEQLRNYLIRNGIGGMLDDPRCAEAALGLARHNVLVLSLGSNSGTYFDAYQVELNPRYGAWDPVTLVIVGSGSLSQVAGS